MQPGLCHAAGVVSCSRGCVMQPGLCHAAGVVSCSRGCVMQPSVEILLFTSKPYTLFRRLALSPYPSASQLCHARHGNPNHHPPFVRNPSSSVPIRGPGAPLSVACSSPRRLCHTTLLSSFATPRLRVKIAFSSAVRVGSDPCSAARGCVGHFSQYDTSKSVFISVNPWLAFS
ncbi:MAG: hypothetical protein JWP89_4979, partial [Schlesneria sp.]|nr:hypothetical protein [Schlesneria sp.]